MFPENLKALELQNVYLGQIDSQTFGLSQSTIQNLSLFQNDIRYIDEETFLSFENLVSLTIENNRLYHNIEPKTFKNLKQLKSLSIINSELKFINKNMFNGLLNLKLLNFDENLIDNIETGTFLNLNLTCLYLRHNQLTIIKPEYFYGLTVKELYLSNNHIKEIKNNSFKNLSIELLDLQNNLKLDVTLENISAWGVNQSIQHDEFYELSEEFKRKLGM